MRGALLLASFERCFLDVYVLRDKDGPSDPPVVEP